MDIGRSGSAAHSCRLPSYTRTDGCPARFRLKATTVAEIAPPQYSTARSASNTPAALNTSVAAPGVMNAAVGSVMKVP